MPRQQCSVFHLEVVPPTTSFTLKNKVFHTLSKAYSSCSSKIITTPGTVSTTVSRRSLQNPARHLEKRYIEQNVDIDIWRLCWLRYPLDVPLAFYPCHVKCPRTCRGCQRAACGCVVYALMYRKTRRNSSPERKLTSVPFQLISHLGHIPRLESDIYDVWNIADIKSFRMIRLAFDET